MSTVSRVDVSAPRRWDRRRMLDLVGENGFIVIFILWCVYLSFATDAFLTSRNIFTVLRQASIVSIVAIGEMLVMLMGAMDISLAAVLGFSGVITAGLMTQNGVPPLIACAIGVALGGLVGLVNGVLVTKVKINAIIATLGMLNVLNGIAFIYAQGQTIYGEEMESIAFLARGYIGPAPVPVILMFAFYAVFYFILNRTVFGAHIYAMGNNEKASWLAGIRVDRVKILAFVLAGLLAGFGGVMQISRQGSATGGMGDEFLFPILTAVILGGISLSGGKGRIQNTLIASIFLVTITNGMVLLGTSIYAQRIVSGLILIIALSLDRLRMRSR
ncbi:MAG TPA: ABC transporter permease [Anaerolineae bacterium]|nr:ABC transporter permease [Anaerolineae bacterium]